MYKSSLDFWWKCYETERTSQGKKYDSAAARNRAWHESEHDKPL